MKAAVLLEDGASNRIDQCHTDRASEFRHRGRVLLAAKPAPGEQYCVSFT